MHEVITIAIAIDSSLLQGASGLWKPTEKLVRDVHLGTLANLIGPAAWPFHKPQP